MTVTSMKLSQEEPVLFRINSFEPNPLPAPLSRPGEMLLAVHRAEPDNHMKINFPLLPAEFQPHLDAIKEALASQDVYWVDWHYDHSYPNTQIPLDPTDRRLLKALSNRQIVPPEALTE